MIVRCPEGHEFEVLTPGEIKAKYQYSENMLSTRRKAKAAHLNGSEPTDQESIVNFPEPFLALGNKYLYLAKDFEDYAYKYQARRRGSAALEQVPPALLSRRLADLTEEELAEVLSAAEEIRKHREG